MIPVGDENVGQRLSPVVNISLIVINVIVFLYELLLPERDLFRFFMDWGIVPARITDGEGYITLLTAMFMHGGWLHIGGNMLFLWIFGDNLEDVMGHVKYLIFYLVCGVAAGLVQVVVDPESTVPVVGASGAIAGVMGGYILLFPRGLIRTLIMLGFFPILFYIPAWIQIGLWFVTQILSGVFTLGVDTQMGQGGVAYFAHIGGFVAGLALVKAFKNDRAYERQKLARLQHRAFQRLETGQFP